MEHNEKHITSYASYAGTYLAIQVLLIVNILISLARPVSLTPVFVLVICCFQAFLMLRNFMHLKYDNLILKIFVGGVFFLFAVIVVITLMDYIYR